MVLRQSGDRNGRRGASRPSLEVARAYFFSGFQKGLLAFLGGGGGYTRIDRAWSSVGIIDSKERWTHRVSTDDAWTAS